MNNKNKARDNAKGTQRPRNSLADFIDRINKAKAEDIADLLAACIIAMFIIFFIVFVIGSVIAISLIAFGNWWAGLLIAGVTLVCIVALLWAINRLTDY